jgi:hypothetical protein
MVKNGKKSNRPHLFYSRGYSGDTRKGLSKGRRSFIGLEEADKFGGEAERTGEGGLG